MELKRESEGDSEEVKSRGKVIFDWFAIKYLWCSTQLDLAMAMANRGARVCLRILCVQTSRKS